MKTHSAIVLCSLAVACGALKKSSSSSQSAPSGSAQPSGNTGTGTSLTHGPIKITPVSGSPSGVGSSIVPPAVADAQTEFQPQGDVSTKAGVCGAWYLQRITKGTSPDPAIADHDISVKFTLSYFQGDAQTTMALYSDATCTTKVSGDMSASSTSTSATITMKSGTTAVAVYVKATPPATVPANDFDAYVTFSSQVAAAGTTAERTVYARYTVSNAGNTNDVMLVPPLNVDVGACVLSGFATRTNVIETNDVAFNVSFAGNQNVKAYSDAACTQAVTSATMKAGTSETYFFIKATGPGSITVDWAAPSLSVTNQTTYIGSAEVSGS